MIAIIAAFLPRQPDRQPFMEQGGIEKPGDSRPDLFRIPAPKAPPDRLGIGEPADQADGQQGEPADDTGVSHRVELLQGRQPFKEKPAIFGLDGVFLQQVKNPCAAGKCKRRLPGKYGHDMADEPKIV